MTAFCSLVSWEVGVLYCKRLFFQIRAWECFGSGWFTNFVAFGAIMRFRNLRLQIGSLGLCCVTTKYDVSMVDAGFEYSWNFFKSF